MCKKCIESHLRNGNSNFNANKYIKECINSGGRILTGSIIKNFILPFGSINSELKSSSV